LARAVLATSLIDRGYQLFEGIRSRFVLACAPDEFYEIFNDLSYGRQDSFRPGTKSFRASLFPFEERAISQYFPSPPANVLVGAAGGGREALTLAHRGYRVVAFDPASSLVASLAHFCGGLPVEAFVGRYERLPMVSSLDHPAVKVDLESRAPFAAAILGWTSFSNLRSHQQCVETLRQFGNLTRGPILVSYFPSPVEGSRARFNTNIGYYQAFSGSEFRAIAERAALNIIELDDKGEAWPNAVLRA
jgi:hypothetical protein